MCLWILALHLNRSFRLWKPADIAAGASSSSASSSSARSIAIPCQTLVVIQSHTRLPSSSLHNAAAFDLSLTEGKPNVSNVKAIAWNPAWIPCVGKSLCGYETAHSIMDLGFSTGTKRLNKEHVKAIEAAVPSSHQTWAIQQREGVMQGMLLAPRVSKGEKDALRKRKIVETEAMAKREAEEQASKLARLHSPSASRGGTNSPSGSRPGSPGLAAKPPLR